MNENEDRKNIENTEIDGVSELLDENWQPEKATPEEEMPPEDMDPEEAAVVAKVLAKMMVSAENAAARGTPEDRPPEPPVLQHVLTEEELLAAEAAEQAAKKTFKGKSKSALRRFISVATPDNKKLAIPAFIAEILALAVLLIILGRYSHVAPPTPTEYADDRHTDVIKCLDGELIVNGVTVKVPEDGNVSYSISYVWAEDDKDYPSVPHAIIASYKGDAKPAVSEEDVDDAKKEQPDEQGGDKVVSSDELNKDRTEDAKADDAKADDAKADDAEESKDDSESDAKSSEEEKPEADTEPAEEKKADAEKAPSEDTATAEEASTLYEISLYKDSFTSEKKMPKGKNEKNWFSDWKTEKTEDAYKFAYKVGNTRGFCISTMDAESAPDDYRTYTYYFAVPENKGVAVYVLEGTCYDPESKDKFTTIIKNAINSIEVNVEET